MRTYVNRDFTYNHETYGKMENGDIIVYLCQNNYLDIIITKLHDTECEHYRQAHMLIHIDNDDLYQSINTVLDKISYDLHYKYTGDEPYHKDTIIHNHTEIKNPNVWNREQKRNYTSLWLPFTRENMEHVSIEKLNDYDDFTQIRGEVDKNGVFTYDYPIIDSCCSYKMYLDSRGKIDYFYDLPRQDYMGHIENV